MSHIIQKFGDWKRINEDDKTPGRERQKGKQGNKIVYIPVDRKTLKLKIVNETDIIDAEGYLRVTSEGVHAFDELLRLIKGQFEIIDYYGKNGGGLNDLVNNIVIYDVDVDRGSRKQVITFRIESKTDLTAGDTSKKINSSVRYVRSDQLRKAIDGALINVDKKNPITSDQNFKSKFKLPFSAANIIGSTELNLIQFLVDAYNTIKKDTKAQSSKIMPRLKAELQAKKLGVASKLFIKAMNAALIIKDSVGLKDATFGEDIEEDITQTLYDFIMNARKALGEANSLYLGLDGDQIFEAESDQIRGFDTDAFISVANTIVPETGDIKVPDNGFTVGMKANAELAKFQKLLYTKFKTVLKGVSAYVNFAAKTGDGKAGNPVGDYGKTTAALIQLIKEGLDKPVWQEADGSRGDGNTITVNFVKRIQDEISQGKIKESSEPMIYLGLDGKSVIVSEDFGVPATAARTSSQPQQKPQQKSQQKSQTGSANVSSSNSLELPNDPSPTWRYKVINHVWNGIDTAVKNSTWGTIINPKYVKLLIQQLTPRVNDGYYINVSKNSAGKWSRQDNKIYSYQNGKWRVQANNEWYEVTAGAALNNLIAAYGSNPTNAASTGTSLKAENKRIMDLVYAYGAGKSYVDTKGAVGSRIIQFHFKPSKYSAAWNDWWNITFYENGDGQSRKSTFSIYDNYNNKVIFRGYLEDFSNGKFKIRTTSGSVLGTFNDTLENLLKRLCYAGDNIFWYR